MEGGTEHFDKPRSPATSPAYVLTFSSVRSGPHPDPSSGGRHHSEVAYHFEVMVNVISSAKLQGQLAVRSKGGVRGLHCAGRTSFERQTSLPKTYLSMIIFPTNSQEKEKTCTSTGSSWTGPCKL